ncbi:MULTISPECIES: hypothetical protein [unclassified Fibrobacter]|uniref:hypothetical protein n=1 Tax=unclassified Fibrobacter TaxID=2634177 RepID=UPI000D6C25BD|nr:MULTISPECIES: hypothetical protein [unclassified Fibrobacter]PWJ68282.1 hypothetical protein BGX12_1087 [Fibrobacter sp. UWR4]PZW65616.1 hypothetical protein C8E88_10307 [Fibrobacter sp. UWR1]
MKKILLAATVTAFFAACSDDSSSSAPNDSSVSSIYELGACNSSNRGETKYVQDKDDNYVCIGGEWIAEKDASTPKSSNSGGYADAITSSDSGENPKEEIKEPAKQEVSVYTTAQTTLTINLLKYEQLKAMDEKNKEDGEPRISFTIKSSKDGIDEMDPVKTTTINLGNDVGYWFGSKEVSVLLPKGINIIQVCPKFVDEDAFFDDEEYTSKKCYAINDVGQKIDKTIKQTDDGSAYYTMDWEVIVTY